MVVEMWAGRVRQFRGYNTADNHQKNNQEVHFSSTITTTSFEFSFRVAF